MYVSPSELGSGSNDSGPGYQAINFDEDSEKDSEDEDVEGIKTRMKFIRREDVNLTHSALRSAAMAEESGRNALGMLGAQGERIVVADRSLELADTQNKIATDKTRELRTLNRSMFAPHISNPFTSKRRLQEREEQIKSERMRQQVVREDLRSREFDSQQRILSGLNDNKISETAQKYKKYDKERSKYMFEEDSEDEALEDEIDNNLTQLHQASKRLHKLALTTNEELKKQNEQLANMGEKVDKLDVGVHLNTSRLAHIR